MHLKSERLAPVCGFNLEEINDYELSPKLGLLPGQWLKQLHPGTVVERTRHNQSVVGLNPARCWAFLSLYIFSVM